MTLPERARTGQVLEIGLFLVLVATPLVFTPSSAAPFVDPKLWLLLVGVLTIAWTRPAVDRRLTYLALAFVGAVAIATAFSIDRSWSLIGTELRGMGLIGLTASAFLLCSGTAVPTPLRERIPYWLFWTGVVESIVAVAARFATVGSGSWRISAFSATIGHRVFVGGFLAMAIIAATAMRRRPWHWLGLVAIASGLSVTAARSAWLAAAVGLGIVIWRGRSWRVVAAVLLPVVIALTAWTVASHYIPKSGGLEFSAAPRFTQLAEGSALERPKAYRAYLRSWPDRPVVGSGPGTGWKGYLTHVRPAEVRVAGRAYADAHNIFLEFLVTTGILGLLAFLTLAVVVARRALRGDADRAWALGAASAAGLIMLLEPLNLVLTPLMFLTAGLAIGGTTKRSDITYRRWLVLPVAVALIVSSADFVASTFENYGATYDSRTALRFSYSMAPWRLLTPLKQAQKRAFDYREKDPTGARDARRLIRDAIAHHSWYPDVRLNAADIELLLDDLPAARRLVAEDLRIFPRDARALEAAAKLAVKAEDLNAARMYARRALRIDPSLQVSLDILKIH